MREQYASQMHNLKSCLVFLFLFLICFLYSAFVVQENQELLIKCISQDLGFSGGKPIAACVIYKCLLHWRSFEVERTSVFDRIIQSIASALEVSFSFVCFIRYVSVHLPNYIQVSTMLKFIQNSISCF